MKSKAGEDKKAYGCTCTKLKLGSKLTIFTPLVTWCLNFCCIKSMSFVKSFINPTTQYVLMLASDSHWEDATDAR